eukprot:TRINITY_DN1917_c1_g1_i4.p1 TRINITY_DN1917_c1_g1~~TRINITY_DN1917_c1_g1_i4.p1  ORF type:complete len:117 (+),score=0.27 TRINITY_DN1917_c1_g1_i4:585-935(+)
MKVVYYLIFLFLLVLGFVEGGMVVDEVEGGMVVDEGGIVVEVIFKVFSASVIFFNISFASLLIKHSFTCCSKKSFKINVEQIKQFSKSSLGFVIDIYYFYFYFYFYKDLQFFFNYN